MINGNENLGRDDNYEEMSTLRLTPLKRSDLTQQLSQLVAVGAAPDISLFVKTFAPRYRGQYLVVEDL